MLTMAYLVKVECIFHGNVSTCIFFFPKHENPFFQNLFFHFRIRQQCNDLFWIEVDYTNPTLYSPPPKQKSSTQENLSSCTQRKWYRFLSIYKITDVKYDMYKTQLYYN
ncbi:hypothetical protein NC653_027999 [Populus alba x Populus x berolinensis]|uniref:Uncharacterized protein n=1 Tax=Populus alba x Populus x berolinensis TaxID=444605 RepID=A0AAD6M7F9_9ROSI|nr:hypothetical protein NC653_027999 [Populus alba x Populus x berolinensis]